MGSRHDVPIRGFLTPSPRCRHADLMPAPDTSYTEASPQPGSPVGADVRSRLSLRMSHAQAQGIDTHVCAAGNPGRDPRGSCRVAYRLEGEAATEWRGWSPPGMLHQCECISAWSSVSTYEQHDLCTVPSSQRIIGAWGNTSSTTGPRCRTLEPTTWTWAGQVSIPGATATIRYEDVALGVLPDERVLAMICGDDGTASATAEWWHVYYSDDQGATWAMYSDRPFRVISAELGTNAVSGVLQQRSRIQPDRRGNVLFVREARDAMWVDYAVQYASNSLGTTYEQVGSTWTINPPKQLGLVLLPSGAIGVISFDGGATRSRVLGSPWQSIEATPPVQIFGSTGAALATWVDDDGAWWVSRSVGAALYLYRSLDEGVTWLDMTSGWPDMAPWYSADGNTCLYPDCAATSMGRAYLGGNSADGGGATTYDGMMWVIGIGGWSNVEATGWYDWVAGSGRTWLPIELPGTIAPWTRQSTGGTDVLTAPGCLRITTAAQRLYYEDATYLPVGFVDYLALVEIDVISGGSTTINRTALDLRSGNGASSRTMQLIFSTTGYAIEDNGVGRGTVTHGIAGRLQVRVHYDENARTASSWYRANTGENWTRGHTDVVINNNAGVVGNRIRWGHITTSSSQSDWYQVHIAWRSTLGQIEPPHEQATLVGKAMSISRYPLVEAGVIGQAAFMAAIGGPGIRDEAHDIGPVCEYSADRMFPECNTSPSEPWRSVARTNQTFAWDFGQVTGLGSGSIAIAALNTNIANIYIYRWTGVAWNLDYLISTAQQCTYTRTGDTIVASGVTPLGRYLWRGELDGAWVDLGGGKYRIIRAQTEGMFDASVTTKQARLWLDGIDGTEPANGTAYIYPRNWVHVIHAPIEGSAYRLLIGSAGNPTDDHRCGNLIFGAVTYPGKQWSRGWSWEAQPNAQIHTARRGSVRVEELGPVARQFTGSWSDGYSHAGIRRGDPDYLEATAGGARATRDDVGWKMVGLLREWQSGAVPVVALAEVPQAGGLIWDPSKFLFGYIASSVGLDNVEGDVDSVARPEHFRSPSFTIKEHT